jgi:hypothetical protein
VGESVNREKSCQVQGEEYHRKILTELLNTLWKSSARCALSGRLAGGNKDFLWKET